MLRLASSERCYSFSHSIVFRKYIFDGETWLSLTVYASALKHILLALDVNRTRNKKKRKMK